MQDLVLQDLKSYSINDVLTMAKVNNIDTSSVNLLLKKIASMNIKTARMDPANLEKYSNLSTSTKDLLSKNFDCDKTLGSGTYGVVYKCLNDNKNYAIKITKSNDPEIKILKYIKEKLGNKNHSNLLVLINSWQAPDNYILQFKEMKESLHDYIGYAPLEPLTIKSIMYQLLSGVLYLHSINIAHLDIKPTNILISNNGIVKLADFGISEKMGGQTVENIITAPYRPPELLYADIYKTKIPLKPSLDIWSCGMVMYELLFKIWFGAGIAKTPLELFGLLTLYFNFNYKIQERLPILDPEFTYVDGKENVNDEQRIFIKKLLVWRETGRPSAQKALKFDYFKGYDYSFLVEE
jgi:serine/threonine protein kinase